jgi:hypothetical protein
MHIAIAGVHFNQHAISLPKLANWSPPGSQPVGLMHDNPMRYARAPKFRTVGFLMIEPLVESLNGQNHKYSPWFTMKSGFMGCPPPGSSTVMEMWSQLSQLSHRSFAFCHCRFRAI